VAPELQRAILAAIEADAWPLFLHGAAGRGKSCAAACLYCRAPDRPIWVDTHPFIHRIIRCRTGNPDYHDNGFGSGYYDYESSLISKIKGASLVVFDDIAVRRPSDAAFEIFLQLVNARQFKPTIYTSNISTDLVELFDNRIASRLFAGTVIEVGGSDQRLGGANRVFVEV
jgi:DNA replication protein DnaC